MAVARLRPCPPTVLLLLLALAAPECRADSGPHKASWSYDDSAGDGPAFWPKLFRTCGGRHQSPVDLSSSEAADGGGLPELDLTGYGRPLKDCKLVNDGHTAKMLVSGGRASLGGGCLGNDLYDLEQVHFHWGRDDRRGSEHTVDGEPFAMEGHLVHRNRKYPSVEEAVKHPDGLAVLGVFYLASPANASRLSPLVEAVEEVSRLGVGHKVGGRLDAMTLRSLLPEDPQDFYCYRNGSLTTPTCDQAVTWTLLARPAHLGLRQVKAFRQLKLEDGSPMVDNFRPVLPLNHRTVYLKSSGTRSASGAGPSLTLLLSASLLFLLLFPVAAPAAPPTTTTTGR